MTILTKEELKKIHDLIGQQPISRHEEGDYAALLDEDDPEGAVGIFNAAGRLKIAMHREVWDQLQKKDGS